MINHNNQPFINIPSALKLVGIIAGLWALLLVISTALAYLPGHPDFSILTTYLSDMSDPVKTSGWPPILFNSGTLIGAPLRYLVIVLLVLRLSQLGAGRAFRISTLITGFISTSGTVLMTAVPFSIAPAIHKLGIPLYFLGVVVLQLLIGLKELSIPAVPKFLPGLCFLTMIVFFIFAALVMLYDQGMVSRTTPIIWEWLSFSSSVVWVFAQSFRLGKQTPGSQISGEGQ